VVGVVNFLLYPFVFQGFPLEFEGMVGMVNPLAETYLNEVNKLDA